MPDDLDLEPIKARLAAAALGGVVLPDLAALVAEVERLRSERDMWNDATLHLSKVRQGDPPTA